MSNPHPLRWFRMARTADRLPSLDGWRAIAVGLVVAYHARAVVFRSGPEFESSAWWSLSVGVDIFFAISGLLITSRMLDEWDSTGAVDLGSFFIRRAFRVLPPANCVLLVTLLLGLFGSPWDAFSCLTFWRNYLPAGLGAGATRHFWSLSLEEQFYLVWPCALLLTGRTRAPRVLFWSILAVSVWRSLVLLEWQTPGIMFRTDLRADGLLWGCLAAFGFRRFRIPGWLLAISVAVAAVVASQYRYGAGWVLLPAALAAAVTSTAQHPGWGVTAVLDWKPLAWVGRMSYSIYLWQQMFLIPSWDGGRLFAGWPVLLRVAVLLLTAIASYYLLEKPFIRMGQRIARERRARQQWKAVTEFS